ncbi:hotdog fold thioesterase [Fodinisporobacter ferrooxydans]|uniref:Hotdog fold thioesterase n=1 Tax=Fodinisporobacter ferrooxydans TaxID=2901836 RepID=A0ABY4CR86_9BACL|nr:hotdog fold thioesterase [Alicyclobacillaceae bacterium MYW30-H2]
MTQYPNDIPNDIEIHKRYYNEICEKLKQDPYANSLGIRLVEVGQGSAIAEIEITDQMLNAHGTTHGAVIFALADFVFAVASNSYGKTSVALSMNIGFLSASSKGSILRAIAVEEKRNNRTAWYQIHVTNGEELVAVLGALAYRKNNYFVTLETKDS